jgi:hypothetical protein
MIEYTHYTYHVLRSEDKKSTFLGMCEEFPKLAWYAQSSLTALNGIQALVREQIRIRGKQHKRIPSPFYDPR